MRTATLEHPVHRRFAALPILHARQPTVGRVKRSVPVKDAKAIVATLSLAKPYLSDRKNDVSLIGFD